MPQLNKTHTVHIVGMYKCGTSWLLHCLAAHPEILAWREFDPYVAALQRDSPRRNPVRKVMGLLHTLTGRLDLAHGHHAFSPRNNRDAFAEFFLGCGWVPLFGKINQSAARQLMPSDASEVPKVADALFDMLQKPFRPERAPKYDPSEFHNTLGIGNFKRSNLINLMTAILACESAREMPKIFYDQITELSDAGTVVAFKAADQIMSLQLLRRDMPESKVVAVVRDARDAMVSAWKFEALMQSVEAPWGSDSQARSLIEFMYAWGVRASAILKAAAEGRLLMIRYEDLHTNFEDTIQKVYQYIGVDSRPETICNIKNMTDFEKVSGGRHRGDEAESVVRKGIVGDWKNVLTPAQAALAWRVARRQMTALGYNQDGVAARNPQG